MNWQTVTLTHEDVSAGRHERLQNEFDNLFTLSGGPKDAGMFKSPEVNMHIYYFSPGAVRIAAQLIARYGGVDCLAPARVDIHPVMGNQDLGAIPFAR